MSKAILVVRVLLGAAFLVFGLNGFLHFFTPPPPTSTEAHTFGMALANSGYIFPMVSAFEVAAAVLLLAGRFVPLALFLLAPVLVNILAFHLALDLAGIGLGGLLSVFEGFLLWAYRDAYRPLLVPVYRPSSG